MWHSTMPQDAWAGRNFSKQYTQRVVDTDNRQNIHYHESMHIQRNEYDSRFITVKYDQRC